MSITEEPGAGKPHAGICAGVAWVNGSPTAMVAKEHEMRKNKSTNIMDNAQWDESLDAMVAAASHHKILLENDEVRVLETRVAPGDRTPIHTHRWPGVLYVISWSDFRRYDRTGQLVFDSRAASSRPEAGVSFWSEPIEPHFVENVGNQELRVIAVELKNH